MFLFIKNLSSIDFIFYSSFKNTAESIVIDNLYKENEIISSTISQDSLSLKTKNELTNKDEKCSFYLNNSEKKNKHLLKYLPPIQLKSMKTTTTTTNETNGSFQNSRHRSIIKDLNSLSNSFKHKTVHHSIDSLFSKDSLVQ